MNFTPKCIATTIGSFPYKEPDKITEKIFETLLDIPNWAQLPNLNFRESMYIQYSEGMPCIVIDENKGTIYFDTSGDIYEKLDIFYEKYVEKDIDYFGITREFSSGFYAFENYLNNQDLGRIKFLKGQVTGPVSFGLTVTDENKRAALYNEGLVDSIVKCCAMKAAWQITRLKRFFQNIIIFIDEPYLSSFGSAFISISREQVIDYINEVTDIIHEYGGIAGVHCCGNTDWSILMDTRVDIINFDAYEYFQGLVLYPEHLQKFFTNGGILAWGIVTTSGKINDENTDTILENFENKINVLSKKGFDKVEILDRCLITPSCGMGTLSINLSDKVLEILNNISTKLREKYYNI